MSGVHPVVLASIIAAGAACASPPPPSTGPTGPPRPAPAACTLPEAPTVVHEDGGAVLLRWELDDRAVLWSPALPADDGYQAFRRAIRDAGAELERPVADRTPPVDDAARETWRREDANAELVHSGRAGTLRPISCLEALLFARQHARHSELTDPTELIAQVLRRDDGERPRLRVYFGAGDEMFPPKSVYGIDQVEVDVAAGWTYVAVLHNHTVQRRGDRVALGSPAPSTNDVHLFRGLVADLGLRTVWVTNGVYTGVVAGADLGRFNAPE